ncbi:filamentous hemagglutinin N-terminal domain-containing protein, partial [Pseudanabaenaceae cyanobacterium LEGE 13415]|nr:filamentous hemagglutinin N-terminal domain-containing protein [Pseudanabaenaceae cyanobacterium LEGE 13415]
MNPARLHWTIASVISALLLGQPAIAQVTPDDTLGSERSVLLQDATFNGVPLQITINGVLTPIDVIRGGARRGNNVFHSFSQFNAALDRGTYFLVPDPQVQNVFARVTGSTPSNILGRLGTFQIIGDGFFSSNANLFLINPNGILFGNNASLEVGGAFIATTANAVRFGDNTFSATAPEAVTDVLQVNPSAFLFNRIPTGDIIVRSKEPTAIESFRGLRVPNNQNLILLGGNVRLEGGQLSAFGGRVEIAAIAGSGVIGLNPNGSLSVPDGVPRADVILNQAAKIDVSLQERGDIGITANNLRLADESQVIAGIDLGGGSSESQAGDIVLNATGAIELLGGSRIQNDVNSNLTGNSGDINITANSLFLSEDSQISASTFGTGDAGNINLTIADRILIRDPLPEGPAYSGILTRVESGAQGNGGNLTVTANTLELGNGGQLSASTLGEGDAGDVTIRVRDRISLTGAQTTIFSSTAENATGDAGNLFVSANTLELFNGGQLTGSTNGVGAGGNVTIDVRDRVSLIGVTGIFSSVGDNATGNAGNLLIRANTLELINGGQLIGSTAGVGSAGNITVEVRDRVSIRGRTGNISSTLFSEVGSDAVGAGGDVQISANTLDLSDGGRINASTFGRGDAGNITIRVRDRVSLTGGQAALFSSVEENATGNGGNLFISANTLELLNGGQLIASTGGRGSAGNVTIEVLDRVLLDGAEGEISSAIFSRVSESGVGEGGNVSITANRVELTNRASLNADTLGQGNAGNVTIQASDRVFLDNSGIFNNVRRTATGNGGNLFIFANTLELKNDAALVANTTGRGNAGNVTIDVRDRVSLDNSNVFSSVDASAVGNGNNLSVFANRLELTGGAQLQVNTAGAGNGGNLFLGRQDRPIQTVSISGTNPAGRSSALFAFTTSDRPGGNIRIFADQFRLSDGGVVDARTFQGGDSGTIRLDANTIDILSGGQILAITQGSGRANSINITARDRLLISGTDPTYAARLSQFGTAVAPISPESGIYTRSLAAESAGSAGSIFLTSPRIELSDRARIDAQSTTVDGGNIEIRASDRLLLRNNSQITATAGTAAGFGNGGNIRIDARFLIAIPKEDSDITANAFRGTGGQVTLNVSGGVLGIEARSQPTEFSDITASSEQGTTGIVTLNAPDSSGLQNSLAQLSQNEINTNQLLANSC